MAHNTTPMDVPPAELTTRTVTFWGTSHEITPLLVHEHFGDGQQLVGLMPLNTRPNYYVVRIDGAMDLDSEAWRDLLDDVAFAIEDEYGMRCRDDDEDLDEHGDHVLYDWPAYNGSSGVSWFPILPAADTTTVSIGDHTT